MRRKDRRRELLNDAEPWDLVVLDEAHHARRSGAGGPRDKGPNTLLRLMQGIRDRTDGLVLLTATPMQVHPVELWDLLRLLGLPAAWTETAFLDFFEDAERPDPAPAALDRMARLFQATERCYGPVSEADPALASCSKLRARHILRTLRDTANTPRRRLSTKKRTVAMKVLRTHTPVRHLVSRHTRDLLRRYYTEGLLATRVSTRNVKGPFCRPDGRRTLVVRGRRRLYQPCVQPRVGWGAAGGWICHDGVPPTTREQLSGLAQDA